MGLFEAFEDRDEVAVDQLAVSVGAEDVLVGM